MDLRINPVDHHKTKLNPLIALFFSGVMLCGLSAVAQNSAPAASPSGVVLSLNGPVTPASAGYLAREISAASDAGKELVIIEIDTPGGLIDSMKTIIKSILASNTPVATYVSPQGARSASAGLYIMYAAHVSAMAPSTNTGAATPVSIGGDGNGKNPFEEDKDRETDKAPRDNTGTDSARDNSEPDTQNPDTQNQGPEGPNDQSVETKTPNTNTPDTNAPDANASDIGDAPRDASDRPLTNDAALRAKSINDSVAYIRSLAQERGRNADWAEKAVRSAASVTSRDALELNVIDYIADDIDDLLSQIDGQTIATAAGEKTLSTSNLRLETIEPTQIEKILGFFANPNVAVILMSLATTGIIIEMWNPGSIFPGVLGATFLLLGLYSFQVLPYNGLGAGLMVLGVAMMAIEAYTPTFGIAGLTGFVAFGAGLYTLFPVGFEVSPLVIGFLLVSKGCLLVMVLFAVISSRSRGPMIGSEAIRRREGYVDDWNGKHGWVVVEGERWRATSNHPLSPGDRIKVIDVDGLVLVVRQAKASGMFGGMVSRPAKSEA